MSVINTNTAATVTANALARNERAMGQTMERLSTGSRINSAADDAAGLAISSKLTSQVRGLDQAQRNANDAISMIQTADGAAIEIDNMLQRMREVSVQASNGTNTSSDIANLNIEFAALATEIDRIVDATQWNGMSILNGSSGAATDGVLSFQIGANNAQSVTVDFSDFNLAAGTASGSGTQGTTDVTISAAQLLAVGTDANAEIHINDGTNTIVIDKTKIAAAGATTDFSGATLAHLAAAITTEIAAAGNAAFKANFGTVAVSNSGITFTQTTGGTGAISSFQTSTDAADAAVAFSSRTVAVGIVGVAPGAAKPMGEDLSGAKSGSITSTTSGVITKLDTAIAGIASQRATFGAAMNRLEYTVDNLANVSQNTSASRSRIQDADYAAETTELARTQIIQQAGTAMLSQANQQAQSVLALLK